MYDVDMVREAILQSKWADDNPSSTHVWLTIDGRIYDIPEPEFNKLIERVGYWEWLKIRVPV